MLHEDLTKVIIECILKVHHTLGPGFLEKIYQNALMIEFANRGIKAVAEESIVVFYLGKEVGWHRLDMKVEDKVIVEIKTVEELCRAHYAKLRSYLRAWGLRVGILANMAKAIVDFRRVEI